MRISKYSLCCIALLSLSACNKSPVDYAAFHEAAVETSYEENFTFAVRNYKATSNSKIKKVFRIVSRSNIKTSNSFIDLFFKK